MSATTQQRPSYTLSLVDREGRVHYQSATIEALLGYKPDDVAGVAWFSFVHHEDAQPVRSEFAELVDEGGAQARWMLRFRAAQGGWQPVEVCARNLLTDPDVRGVLLSLRAIGQQHTSRSAS